MRGGWVEKERGKAIWVAVLGGCGFLNNGDGESGGRRMGGRRRKGRKGNKLEFCSSHPFGL